jgi:hypothetical protein
MAAYNSGNHVPTETISSMPDRRLRECAVDFNLERSRESRHRHRVLISARHFAALFEPRDDRVPSLH